MLVIVKSDGIFPGNYSTCKDVTRWDKVMRVWKACEGSKVWGIWSSWRGGSKDFLIFRCVPLFNRILGQQRPQNSSHQWRSWRAAPWISGSFTGVSSIMSWLDAVNRYLGWLLQDRLMHIYRATWRMWQLPNNSQQFIAWYEASQLSVVTLAKSKLGWTPRSILNQTPKYIYWLLYTKCCHVPHIAVDSDLKGCWHGVNLRQLQVDIRVGCYRAWSAWWKAAEGLFPARRNASMMKCLHINRLAQLEGTQVQIMTMAIIILGMYGLSS